MAADVDDYFRLPLDASLLEDGLVSGNYAMALQMFLEHEVIWPLYEGLGPKEIAEQLAYAPPRVAQEIKQLDAPALVKEFLLAVNVRYWMTSLGLSAGVDTVFTYFSREYQQSAYLSPLERQRSEWLTIAAGAPAPDITGTTPHGTTITLEDLKGKVVYVDVWATWCKPCRAEFPASVALQREFSESEPVTFLYVSVDRDQHEWKNLVATDEVPPGKHILGQSTKQGGFDIFESYKVSGIPRYILIDSLGNIANANAPRPSLSEAADAIRALL